MERYYVKRPTGKVFGPFDENAIRLMLKGNKLGTDAQVSTDKESWTPISAVDAFADVLGSTTRAGVGLQDLPASSAGSDLPQSRSAGMDLPQSRGAGPSLPKPVSSGMDLPRPKSDGPALPRPKSMPDLPRPKSSLPNLPRAKDDAELPRSVSDNLPGAGSQLPRSAGDNLPGAGGQLPRSAGDNLPEIADILPPQASAPPVDDDLFGSPIEDDDDLFAAPAGLDDDSDDLFASPAGLDDDSDDLFASPAGLDDDSDDDLFASPAAPSAPDPFADDDPLEDDDDLFEAGPMDDDDLFAAAPADEDDFLGGDQGFSFLDDEPADNDSGGLEDWEENLVGNDAFGADAGGGSDAWGDDLLDNSPGAAPPPSGPSRPAPQQPASGEHDPFRPASSGIKDPAAFGAQTPGQKATTSREQAVDADKKRGLTTLVGVPLLAVLLLGGVGYGIYTFMGPGEDGPQVVTDDGPRAVELSLDQIREDNFHDLLHVIEHARDGSLDDENRGRLLLAKALYLLRYDDDGIAASAEALAGELMGLEGETAIAVGLATYEALMTESDAARGFARPHTNDPEYGYFAYLAMGIADARAHFDGRELDVEPPPASEPAEDDLDEEQGEDELSGQEETELAEVEEEAEEEPAGSSEGQFALRAIEQFEAAAAAEATAASPHYWLARLAIFNGDDDDAVAHFERAANADPNHVASRLLAGQTYYQRGDLNHATEHLRKIIDEIGQRANDEERGLAFHLIGMVHMARQESDQAIDMFTRALNTDSSRTDSLRALAREYERSEKYEEALNFFTTDENLGQQDPEVMLGIVRSHMGLTDYVSATHKLEEGEEEFPEDARFPYYLGQLNLQRNRTHEAREAFERAVEIDPDLLDAHAALATLALRIDNDPAQSETHVRAIAERGHLLTADVAADVAEYYRSAGHLELARQWNEEALRRDPNFWEARLSLSQLLLDEKRSSEALVLLERARDEGIQDLRLSANLADAYRQDGQYDRAIDEINTVISEQSDNSRYIFIRGRIYYDQGNYATAREDFINSVQLDPRFHDASFFVGRTHLAQQDYSTAIRVFRQVLDYQPDNGEIHYFMGMAYEADGSLNQALESYRRATAVDAQFARENPHIYIHRGRLLSGMGFTQRGRADIQRALEINPDMPEALLAMAETNYRERDYAGAIENYARALRDHPGDADSHYRLGMSYVYENQNQNGARHLQLAIRNGYDDPDIYRTLGYIYRDLGQRSQAIESFRTFLREADGSDVPDAIRREMLAQIRDLGG